MTANDMKQVYYSFKCKQAIEAEGLYEKGMSDQDIKVVYKTLRRSVESAGNDKEYREILNRTEINCSNIDMLTEESNINNDETVDVTSIQPASPKPQSLSKSFSSFFKKNPSIKNINVFMETRVNRPSLKLRNVDSSNAPLLFYHQEKILKLPLEERANAIAEYLLKINEYTNRKKNTNKFQWSSPIEPRQGVPFNGDLCIDFIPDAPEEVQEEIVDSFKIDDSEGSTKDNSFISSRPKRVVKRKNYKDQETDDEDDFTTTIKKTKSNDDLNIENSSESKWLKRGKKKAIPKTPLHFLTGTDRTNKIFNQLKWGDSSNSKTKKNTAEILQETLDLSSSEEEIFPTVEVTTANIHKKEDRTFKNRNGKTVKEKKNSPKKRGAYNKLSVQNNSATKENESPEIPTQNFYAKNKNSFDVDESNNNKLEKNEDKTNCPICNRPFPASIIEAHASNCTQYEGQDSETFCNICNEYIPDKKFQSHKYECLRKITEASVAVDKPVTRSQRGVGFLCQVCDKYISNASEMQHASNCIAKI